MQDQNINRLQGIVIALAVVALMLATGLTPRGAATTIDSLYYLEAGESFAHGHGISQPNFELTGNDEFKPVTMWPPLYPIALTPFLLISDRAEMAAGYFNAVFLGVALIAFFLIAKRSFGLIPAGLLALFLAMQPPVIAIYSYAWSETLFTPLILLAYLFGLKYIEAARSGDGKAEKTWLLLSAVFLGLAANTRYIGVVFLPGLLLMIWFANSGVSKKAVLYGLGAGALIVASLVPMFVRNYLYSGYFSGAERGTPPTHYLGDTLNLLKVLALNLFNFHFVVSLVLVLALLIVFIFAAMRMKKQTIAWSSLSVDVLLPLAWASIYFAALIVLRGIQTIDLDTRMIAVVVPFILLAAAGLAKQLMAYVPAPVALSPFLLWAVFQTFQGYEAYGRAVQAWRTDQLLVLASEKTAYANLSTSPFTTVAKGLYEDLKKTRGDFIVFNEWRPMLFKHLVNAKVKQVPLPLTAATVARINAIGGSTGVFWITSNEGMSELSRAYGNDLSRLKFIKEAAAIGITIIALPLPTPKIK